MRKITIFLILVLAFFPWILRAEEKSDAPILDPSSLSKAATPHLFLSSFESQTYSSKGIKEIVPAYRVKEAKSFLGEGSVKHIHEFWSCIDPKSKIAELWGDHNISDLKRLLPSSQKDLQEIEKRGINISIDRYYLKDAVTALAWAEKYIRFKGFITISEGSYSGQPFGYKCWSFKPSESMDVITKRQAEDWNRSSKQMIFVYKNAMVHLYVNSPSHNEVPASYIEDVARIIISKL